jgi:hypothetical protein
MMAAEVSVAAAAAAGVVLELSIGESDAAEMAAAGSLHACDQTP